MTAGIPDSPLNGYYRARNAPIAFNTVVDFCGPYIDQDAGFGSSGCTLRPENITIANNLFALSDGGTLLKGVEGERFQWLGNIASAGRAHPGIRLIDPKLVRWADGQLRSAADRPARGAAEGSFAAVKTDIDGQPRTGHLAMGCDHFSDSPVTYRPLTPADVGPSWMDRQPPKKVGGE